MTLKELAKRAGVSISTVSRVVNGNDSHAAGEAVRDRIWQLVHETGYIPNASAQSLKIGSRQTGSSHQLSLACFFARTEDRESGQFFSELFRSIEQECAHRHYHVTGIYPSLEQKEFPADLRLPQADGVIVLGRCRKGLLQQLCKNCRHVILVGLNEMKDSGCDQVICDGYEAAKTAVRYLVSLGHRHIAYVGEQSEEARYRGYFDAMRQFRLPIQKEFIINTPLCAKGGHEAGKRLMTLFPRPTAVFCANDVTAIGVMKAVQQQGLHLPEELSVVSIDDVEMCKYCTPMLSSIHISKGDLGRFAVKTLIDRIEGGHSTPIKIDIPFTLIERESCTKNKQV